MLYLGTYQYNNIILIMDLRLWNWNNKYAVDILLSLSIYIIRFIMDIIYVTWSNIWYGDSGSINTFSRGMGSGVIDSWGRRGVLQYWQWPLCWFQLKYKSDSYLYSNTNTRVSLLDLMNSANLNVNGIIYNGRSNGSSDTD